MYFDIYFIILLILIKYDNGISKALYCKGKNFFFFQSNCRTNQGYARKNCSARSCDETATIRNIFQQRNYQHCIRMTARKIPQRSHAILSHLFRAHGAPIFAKMRAGSHARVKSISSPQSELPLPT